MRRGYKWKLLLPPNISNIRQDNGGKYDKDRNISAEQIVPVGSNRNSQSEHAPFEKSALPPFQAEGFKDIHAQVLFLTPLQSRRRLVDFILHGRDVVLRAGGNGLIDHDLIALGLAADAVHVILRRIDESVMLADQGIQFIAARFRIDTGHRSRRHRLDTLGRMP